MTGNSDPNDPAMQRAPSATIWLAVGTLRRRLAAARQVEGATWLAALGVRGAAVRERKQHVIACYEGLWIRALARLVDCYEAQAIQVALGQVETLQAELPS